MAVYVDRTSLEIDNEEDPSRICSIPCKIGHDGEANVDKYFYSTISKTDADMSSSFRGRGLNGKHLDLPDGYTGIVLKEDKKPFLEEEDRHFKVTHKFNKFTYWNWDCLPSSNDAMIKSMLWPTIAKAIHSPISTESSQHSSTNGSR
ncbi:ribonuclease H2 subunit C-like [Saccoglossus kowalevskii]|uniref:Ribonuclease H2 subunit C-like n=1 Tax=Saccoglossus kowalevskii TaxID=10224 RepID=A0ABM0GZX3_SACKO|nr:PREDICTED: ribonuclease H2 subunit C-like [Saccoglossus kowalevskii]